MTSLFDKARRAVAAALLPLLLCGCGPGVGGTGTGPTSLDIHFAGQAGNPVAGSVCQGAQCNTLALTLQDAHIELVGACVRFVHDGGWALGASDVVVGGTVEVRNASGVVSSPATLQLQFTASDAAGSAQVTVALRDGNGTLLLGPVLLLRGDAAGTPAGPTSCGAP